MASGGQRDIEVESHLGRTTESEFLYYAKSERAFKVSVELTNASQGDTATLHIENPPGSGVSGIFAPIMAEAADRSYARVYDSFSTAPSGGTATDVQNVLLDSAGGAPDTGELSANTGVSFTESATHASRLVGSGVGGNSLGGSESLPVLALEPDREIVIEVEKLGTGNNQVPITARWYEAPVVYSEESEDPEVGDVTRGRA